MNKFWKGCLMFSVICLLLGGLLLGVGTLLGARPSQYMNLAHLGGRNTSLGFWKNPLRAADIFQDDLDDLKDDLDDLRDSDEFDDLEDLEDVDISEIQEFITEDEDWHHRTEPGSHVEHGSGSYDETFSDREIQKLEIQVAYGEIYIYPYDGEGVRVRASNCGRTFQCWQEDEELYIRDNRKHRDHGLMMELYLPEKELRDLEVELGAGRMYANNLYAEKAELNLGAGICEIQSLCISDQADLGIGTGTFQVQSFEGSKLDGSCGAGEMELNMAGAYEEYDYELTCGIGTILLNGNRYSGLGVENSIDNRAHKKVDLDCGVGEIQVKFVNE